MEESVHRRVSLAERAKKALGEFRPVSERDNTVAWADVIHGQHVVSRYNSLQHARKRPKTSICLKEWYETVKYSSFTLRLCERIYQSPHHSINQKEFNMLSELLYRILFQPGEHTNHLWSVVQSRIAVNNGTQFHLERVYHAGAPVLQKFYTKYADKEDEFGPYIAPRSAHTFLAKTSDRSTSFGGTSWYIIHVTCTKSDRAKPLAFDVKVGITEEAANSYWLHRLPVDQMRVKCMTPYRISDLGKCLGF